MNPVPAKKGKSRSGNLDEAFAVNIFTRN